MGRRVDLKACLGLVLPKQYCPLASSGKIEAGFRLILFRGPRLLLGRPYYEPLLWFMKKRVFTRHKISQNFVTNQIMNF